MKQSTRVLWFTIAFFIVGFALLIAVPASSLIVEENFTADNSVNGQTAASAANLSARGWKDGISSIGTGYKFEQDATLGKPVMYVSWATTSGPQDPDGTASAIRRSFAASRDVTMYALVKFHNWANSPTGGHWVRFHTNANGAANSSGQQDLDVSGNDQDAWLIDPTTKKALPETVNGQQQQRGFRLYSGGSLSYGSLGKSNVYQDDVWYEVVWYLKNSTTSGSPTTVSDGAMRVYIRPYGSADWSVAFDGANFVTTSYTASNTSAWMIGPYLSSARWTNDIRQYFSRVAIWSGDAYGDGTLAAFLNTNTPAPIPIPIPPTPTPTPTPIQDCQLVGTKSSTSSTVTWKQIPASGGGKPCPANWVIK